MSKFKNFLEKLKLSVTNVVAGLTVAGTALGTYWLVDCSPEPSEVHQPDAGQVDSGVESDTGADAGVETDVDVEEPEEETEVE